MRIRRSVCRRGVFVAVALTLVVASCGTGDDSATGVGTPRTLNTSGGAAAAEVVTGDAVPLPDALLLDPLEPGTYETTLTHRPVTFTVGDGWYLLGQSSGGFSLARVPTGQEAGEAPQLGIFFMDDATVRAFEDPLAPEGESDLIAVPQDLAAWLQGMPGLDWSDPEPVTVGGVEAVALPFTVDSTPSGPFDCLGGGVGCHPVFQDESGPLVEVEGSRGRFIVLEQDRTLIALDAVSAESFDEFLPLADAVIDTMEIG